MDYTDCKFFVSCNHCSDTITYEEGVVQKQDGILLFQPNNKKWAHYANIEHLFKIKEEADKEYNRLKSLQEGFEHDYIRVSWLNEHLQEIRKLKSDINNLLQKYPNFCNFDLCDVSADGVQVRLFLEKVPKYSIHNQPTIAYDCSNLKEVLIEVEKEMSSFDDEQILSYQNFIYEGEKYGWD